VRIWPQCIPCILNARMREILDSDLSREEKIEAGRKLLELLLREVSANASTIRVASRGFQLVKQLIGDEDPYRDYKRRSNELALKVLPEIEKRIRELEPYERFRFLVLVSINANSLDPGVPPFSTKIEDIKPLIFGGTFTLDHTKEIYCKLKEAKEVLFILDNAGEAVVDLLLVRELYEMGLRIRIMAKSMPYQNDVTVDEALELGFDKYGEVIGTGSDYGGPLPEGLSEEAKKALQEVDLIVAKGMANYEAFLYSPPPRPVAHLLKAKCVPVASTLGVKKGANVAILRA